MKKILTLSLLLLLAACFRYSYDAKEEFKGQVINDSKLSSIDMTIGIQFNDETAKSDTQNISGDLASETASWLTNYLSEEKKFTKVVNLNKNKDEEVDVVLKGIIKQINLEDPGMSDTAKKLAFFYGIAPLVEHYAAAKEIDSTAVIRFQLLEPKSQKLLWDQLLTKRVSNRIQLSKANKLIFATITKTIETLLTETRLPEVLKIVQTKDYAKLAQEDIPTSNPEKGNIPPSNLAKEETHASNIKTTVTTAVKDPSAFKSSSQRWAVIIGVSNYQDPRIPGLRYADADAKMLYDWIISPQGGRYAPSRVKVLINEEATGRNIKNVLFVWLKQALEEDVVVIYFAGHGSPESPDSSQNLFLLPYDTDHENIAATGFPMWDVETALKRFIKAKRVIVLADACHSGGVGKSFDVARRDSRSLKVNPISAGLQSLSKMGEGVCVISASDDRQFSQEDKKWGGGHGVFTHFLIEGLKGSADYSKDGFVSLGELIPYLSEQVRRETESSQSPTVAGKFDPAITIAK